MIKSIISSSHHYYLAFLQGDRIKTADDIISNFPEKKDFQVVVTGRNKIESIIHLQIELESAYGSEVLLAQNRSKQRNGKQYYWYDFYLGCTDSSKKIFFIAYPYRNLSKYLDKSFKAQLTKPKYYKADVPSTLNYMKTRRKATLAKIERDGFTLDITKFSAEVKEEANANKVNLIGANPLNSRIYDVLNDESSITIEATALKLKCAKSELGQFELSFDRLGNFRFWLKREESLLSLDIIKYVFQFFQEIGSLNTSLFLSHVTFLEDE